MRIFFVLLTLVLIFVFACSRNLSGQRSLVLEASEDQIGKMDCAYLGKVEGDYRIWQAFIPLPFAVDTADSTKVSALKKASEMGATHVVWREKGRWEFKMALAEGHAYRCK